MTKRREPLTFHRALTKIASIIGWDCCGAICGVSEKSVRNWSDPDVESEIRLIDAERLDRACLAATGHAPFLEVYTLRLDVAAHQDDPHDVALMAAAAAKETGEAVSALVLAATPNADRTVIRAARRELEEAIRTLTEGLAALDQREAQQGGR